MKKQILSACLVLMIFQMQIKVFARCGPADPYSCIDPTTASNRMSAFVFKKNVLNANGIAVNDFNFNAAQLNNLKVILFNLRGSATPYDGIRLHFALSGNTAISGFAANTIYIILVPTIQTSVLDQDGVNISVDDEAHAFIISDGTFTPVNMSSDLFVHEWINRYINVAARKIENAYLSRGIEMQETHSLWYSKRTMFFMDADGLGPDLLTYLQSHTFTQANIHFAAWIPDLSPSPIEPPFPYKTSLIFDFMEENAKTSSHLTFEMTDMVNKIKKLDGITSEKRKELIALLQETYTDTGNPCPTKKCP